MCGHPGCVTPVLRIVLKSGNDSVGVAEDTESCECSTLRFMFTHGEDPSLCYLPVSLSFTCYTALPGAEPLDSDD